MDEVASRVADKIKNYQPSEAAEELVRETRLLLVAGTAAAGKNTIIEELLETGKYRFIVSHTTRKSRKNEQNGKNYYFTDWPTTEAMVDEHRFVEVSINHRTDLYGASIDELTSTQESGLIGISDIDVKGVQKYVGLNPDVKAVFLLPPSYDEWMRRLAIRGHDQDELKRRLETAQTELEHALKAGHFHFVINADLDKAVADVREYAENPNFELSHDATKVEHAWHVLGELKRNLNS